MHNKNIEFLINSVSKFNNLLKLKKNPIDLNLSIDNLPSKDNVNLVYNLLLKGKNNNIKEILKSLNSNTTEITKKVMDVHYANDKFSSVLNSDTEVSNAMNTAKNCICRLKINPQKSVFAVDNVYENDNLVNVIEAINNHPCKVTRLFNGKINIEIITTKPINHHNYMYVYNSNFNNKPTCQFKSTYGLVIDENLVDSIRILQPENMMFHDMLLSNNQLMYNISEESFFHYHNMTDYSDDYFTLIQSRALESYSNFDQFFNIVL